MIKRIVFLSLIVMLAIQSQAQRVELSLTLMDLQQQPMPGIPVVFTELETRQQIVVTTGPEGKANVEILGGNLWTMDILEIRNYPQWLVRVPQQGTFKEKRLITYDLATYRREMEPLPARDAQDFRIEKQQFTTIPKPDQGRSVITILLEGNDDRPIGNMPVSLFCYADAVRYDATTNPGGEASFRVPKNRKYQIDIEGIENYSYIDLPGREGGWFKKGFVFEPINFSETITKGEKTDTVRQQLPEKPEGCSGRVMLRVKFMIRGGGPAANQKVWLKDLERGTVYESFSTQNGTAYFMLPKGRTYGYVTGRINAVEFTRELADLRYAFGISQQNKTVYLDPEAPALNTVLDIALPEDEAQMNDFLQGSGIRISKFRHNGPRNFARNWICFADPDKLVSIPKGFLLTTGSVFNAFGPNDLPGASGMHSWQPARDIPLAMQDPEYQGYDPCVLSFDLIPEKESLVLEFVFASEEYPEYLDYDDAFGIFLTGSGYDGTKNLAALPGGEGTVSVKQLNHSVRSEWYVPNENPEAAAFQSWQYDGFSKKFTVRIPVDPGASYKLKWVIFDRRDAIYDSGVFVGMRSE